MRRLKDMRPGWKRLTTEMVLALLVGMAVNLIWFMATGHNAVWWVRFLIIVGVGVLWDAVQSFRLSRAFWDLVTTYELHPAYGEDPDEFWDDQD